MPRLPLAGIDRPDQPRRRTSGDLFTRRIEQRCAVPEASGPSTTASLPSETYCLVRINGPPGRAISDELELRVQ